jgi:hypothetical protein
MTIEKGGRASEYIDTVEVVTRQADKIFNIKKKTNTLSAWTQCNI